MRENIIKNLITLLVYVCVMVSGVVYANTCPAPPVQQTNVMINEINVTDKWLEFYVPPNVTVNFKGWTLTLNSSGNNKDGNGLYSVCSEDCIFTGGLVGNYVIYGVIPTGVSVSNIPNSSFSIHNQIQEILLLDQNQELVHYLNYSNNNNNNSFEYLACIAEYPDLVTVISSPHIGGIYCTNEDGLVQEQNADYTNWSGCDTSTIGSPNIDPDTITLNHYRILHPETGLTCLASDITIQACANADCSTFFPVAVDLTLSKSDGTNTVDVETTSFSIGATVVSLSHTVAQTITLSLSNAVPAAPTSCYNLANVATSCNISFADAGFVLTLPDSFTSSATDVQTATIQAVKRDQNTQSCAPDYQGSKSINVDFEYVIPDSNSIQSQQNLIVSADGQTFTNVSYGSGGQNLSLLFSAGTASANFFFKYPEAGQIGITVKEAIVSTGLLAGTATTNAVPYQLYYSFETGNNTWLPTTYKAGLGFVFKIQAITNDATSLVTYNYQPGDLQFDLTLPNLVGTTNQLHYGQGVNLLTSDEDIWQSVNLTFNQGIYEYTESYIADLGTITFDVRDANYLNRYVIPSQGQNTVSRFVPAYYKIDTVTQGTLTGQVNTFAYFGETLSFEQSPTFIVSAYNYNNELANNFGGGTNSETLVFTNNTFINRVYNEQKLNTGFDGGTLATANYLSFSDLDDYDGVVQFTLTGDQFLYAKTATPRESLISEIELTLGDLTLTDTDGIGYCADNNEPCLNGFDSFVSLLGSQLPLRYGRFVAFDGYGPADVNYKLQLQLQYYDGNGYQINSLDNHTSFANLTAEITDLTNNQNYTINNITTDTTSFTSGVLLEDNGPYLQTLGVSANLLVQYDNVPSYLNVDWNDDGTIDNNDMANATIILGTYRGNDRIIYKRER